MFMRAQAYTITSEKVPALVPCQGAGTAVRLAGTICGS
jgi:hypothetical protein